MDDHKRRSPGDATNIAETQENNLHAQFTAKRIKLALGNNPMEAGTPVTNREFTLSELAGLLTLHKSRANKIGSYFCCPMTKSQRNGENAQPWNLFPLDFDGKDGDKPDPESSKAFFSTVWHVGYSTHSYTPENGKHRVVLLLSREIDKTEYKALFDAFAEVLPFPPDPKLNHPDQPVFLPSCPPGSAPIAWVNESDKPLDVDAWLTRYKRTSEAESRAERAYKPSGDSVIAAFNDAHDIVSILEKSGYKRRGKRYIHPQSESGIPSVSILSNGNICCSHSSSDPLGDSKPHDAFDVWCILEHQGDKRKATKAAAKLLGMKQKSRAKTQDEGKALGAIDLFDDDGKKKSQATLLIELASRFEAFHDADDNAYCIINSNGIRQVLPVRSKAFKQRLAGDFFELTSKGCNGNSINDALATIEAKAIHHGRLEAVYLRVASKGEKLYLDMGNDAWSAIEVDADGWRELDRPPVYFVRKQGMAELPRPQRPGNLNALKSFLNLKPGQWKLVVGWLLGALRHFQSGRGSYPVLVLQGEQATGKSTVTRVLRVFVDPSTVPLRNPPKDSGDLMVSASNNHVVVMDNLSGMAPDISDDICRLATGGGLDKRKLFTDNEQTLIDIQRPVLVNGIDDIATRPDLASRSVILHLPILEAERVKESGQFWRDFDEAKGSIMAGILDALSCAIREKGTVIMPRKPRMADFAEWVTAAEPALGWQAGAFLAAYNNMLDRAVADGIEASAVGSTLVDYMQSIAPTCDWSPTPTHLYDTLTERAGIRAKTKGWPHSPRGMGNILNRLAPSLRAIGIYFVKEDAHERRYKFTRVAEEAPKAHDTHREAHNPNENNDLGMGAAGRFDDGMCASGRIGAHRSAHEKEAHREAHTENPNKINDKGVMGASCASSATSHVMQGDRI